MGPPRHGSRDLAEPFTEDPRYAASKRELWLAVAYWVVWTTAVVAIAWLLGGGEEANELDFVLGFPAWFFWSAIVCSLVFSLIPYFIVKFGFTHMPLTTDGKPEAVSRDFVGGTDPDHPEDAR